MMAYIWYIMNAGNILSGFSSKWVKEECKTTI